MMFERKSVLQRCPKKSIPWQYLFSTCLFLHSHFTTGYATIITDPVNLTSCRDSIATFICAANETAKLGWISSVDNGTFILPAGYRTFQDINNLTVSVLTTKATSSLQGVWFRCYYTKGSVIQSRRAYLSIQAPPSAPSNLTAITLNGSSTFVTWKRPLDSDVSSLSYSVLVINESGTAVYNQTVRELQTVITIPDVSCNHYVAVVTAFYASVNDCYGNSTRSIIIGAVPPTTLVDTSLEYPLSSKNDVAVLLSLAYQAGLCYLKIFDTGTQSVINPTLTVLSGNKLNVTIFLPSKKNFNLVIAAYNNYGNTTLLNTNISTFDVIGVNISSSNGLECFFNPGSLARGCLVLLTDVSSNMTHCRVVPRSQSTPVNVPLCPSASSNSRLIAGVYSIQAYEIQYDGSLFFVPDITGKIVTLFDISARTVASSLSPNGTPTTSASPTQLTGSPPQSATFSLAAVLSVSLAVLVLSLGTLPVVVLILIRGSKGPSCKPCHRKDSEEHTYDEVKGNKSKDRVKMNSNTSYESHLGIAMQ